LTYEKESIFDNITKKRYTFGEMEERAVRLSHVLLERGVSKGDRVAAYAKNRLEMLDLFFACGKIGAIMVPFNVRLAKREVDYLIGKTDPMMMIYDPDIANQFNEIRRGLGDRDLLVMGDTPIEDDPSMAQLMMEASTDSVECPELVFEDPHLIVFTGGTTGLPKGAVLSHRGIYWNSVNTIVSWGLRPDDVQPLLFPLFHTGGWNVLLVPFYHLGAKTVLMGDFNPAETLRVIEEEESTIVIGVPTMLQMIAQDDLFQTTDFSSVRVFISGGAPCPVAIMEQYWNRGKPLKMGYGLTECGPNNFYLPIPDIERKPTSVGFPVIHCDMRIVDDDMSDVPQGNVGELILKGPHVFNGYWNDPEETTEVLEPDGWLHTGDLAQRDDEGFYYIVGRKKDMYISGGENVFPTEIEELLYKHPAILEAAVIGVPDEKWGEVGKAIVSLKKGHDITEEALRLFLDGKLARYKIPKYYEIRDSLPKSGAGKILKRELEEEQE
jgi:fatty-acyl-CoA synthase